MAAAKRRETSPVANIFGKSVTGRTLDVKREVNGKTRKKEEKITVETVDDYVEQA